MNTQLEKHSNINQRIIELALEVGFDACGISKAEPLLDKDFILKRWIEQGFHGEMSYMERNLDKRVDPKLLVTNAKSIISVLLNYYPGDPSISTSSSKISRYAISVDYHSVVKNKLYQFLKLINDRLGKVTGRAFVDSAPVLEKLWGANAGLGWIGNNSLLIHPKLGSYCFIGELIVDIDIEPTLSTIANSCGSCTKCMDACPTGAIVSRGVIDSRKCISYLTIEKRSGLTDSEKEALNGWCFGCDICQEVCPWNSKKVHSKCEEIYPKQELLSLLNDSLKELNKESFDRIFSETPINRITYEKFRTNIE